MDNYIILYNPEMNFTDFRPIAEADYIIEYSALFYVKNPSILIFTKENKIHEHEIKETYQCYECYHVTLKDRCILYIPTDDITKRVRLEFTNEDEYITRTGIIGFTYYISNLQLREPPLLAAKYKNAAAEEEG